MSRSVNHDLSLKTHEWISETVAGGETSYARTLGGFPIVIERSVGPYLYDVDGNRYIDYCCGYGVNLFGHNPRFVVEAVEERMRAMGPHFAFPHRLYGEVGERVADLVPGVEQVRFTNSGTEATMAAMRIARGATERNLVIKFEGAYHGWADVHYAGLTAPNNENAGPHRPPDSAGVPPGATSDLLVCSYNDVGAVDKLFDEHGEEIAGVLVETVLGSGALLGPAPGFLDFLRARTRANGSLLIFDDVMMGFRLAPGGSAESFGVTPDITTLGKVAGGGFALGLVGGSREVMAEVASGHVVHGGTYSGSPVVLAAAREVLDQIAFGRADLYADLEARTQRLADGIEAALQKSGVIGHVRRRASMLHPMFGSGVSSEARTYRDVVGKQDDDLYARFCTALLERGVFAHRYPLGRWFVSTAHDDHVVDQTLDAAASALEEVGR
jgi:glutamate-1-semialdehyde 2,1-aminomutase